eukprot:g685.t1
MQRTRGGAKAAGKEAKQRAPPVARTAATGRGRAKAKESLVPGKKAQMTIAVLPGQPRKGRPNGWRSVDVNGVPEEWPKLLAQWSALKFASKEELENAGVDEDQQQYCFFSMLSALNTSHWSAKQRNVKKAWNKPEILDSVVQRAGRMNPERQREWKAVKALPRLFFFDSEWEEEQDEEQDEETDDSSSTSQKSHSSTTGKSQSSKRKLIKQSMSSGKHAKKKRRCQDPRSPVILRKPETNQSKANTKLN